MFLFLQDFYYLISTHIGIKKHGIIWEKKVLKLQERRQLIIKLRITGDVFVYTRFITNDA